MHLHYYSKTIGSHYIMTPNCFNKYAIAIGRGKSPITDPLSYLSKYKSYQKIIYT